jgi:hypothetical protein
MALHNRGRMHCDVAGASSVHLPEIPTLVTEVHRPRVTLTHGAVRSDRCNWQGACRRVPFLGNSMRQVEL